MGSLLGGLLGTFLFLSQLSVALACDGLDDYEKKDTLEVLGFSRPDIEKLGRYFKYPLRDGACPYDRVSLTEMELDRLEHPTKTYRMDLQSAWDCYFLNRNLNRNSRTCDVSPKLVFDQAIKPFQRKKIEGAIAYLGFYYKTFKYDLYTNKEGALVAEVRVYFKRGEGIPEKRFPKLLEQMDQQFWQAEAYWSERSPNYKRFKFRFKVVRDPKQAHYNVTLQKDYIRGPYDQYWSIKTAIRHELGHMMGLDEEYHHTREYFREYLLDKPEDETKKNSDENNSDQEDSNSILDKITETTRDIFSNERKTEDSKSSKAEDEEELNVENRTYKRTPESTRDDQYVTQCGLNSLMCDPHSGDPRPYHYYLIFRRAFCSSAH